MSNDEIDRKIAEWHDGDSELPLHEYLGMSWESYSAWVADPSPIDPLNVQEGL